MYGEFGNRFWVWKYDCVKELVDVKEVFERK
jgi:hypothetical protein